MKRITKKTIDNFKHHLICEEKADATLKKYLHDVLAFSAWIKDRNIDKALTAEYKRHLTEIYSPSSVNSIISSLNSFFEYVSWFDCRIRHLKIQKPIFSESSKELTKAEYERLLTAAAQNKNQRLYLLMQTVCSTGIRISELKFITVEALKLKQAHISCKGKMRVVILPEKLIDMLKKYARDNNIKEGSIFISRNRKPLDRSNIWSDMKKLCALARVSKEKVFPHNLRHLFARTYYSLQKDIVRLADILGHSSVNTTRIYTMETGEIHRLQIQKLGLLRC